MSQVSLSPIENAQHGLTATSGRPSSIEVPVVRADIDDVQARAQACLLASPYREVQRTTCLFHSGVLLLHGQVSSFYLKQIAQTILLNVDGVQHLVNTIQVRAADGKAEA